MTSDKIFCTGDLLHLVQMSRVFEDSKTFVDMKMKYPPTQILQNFTVFTEKFQTPTKLEVKQFVLENFVHCVDEFENYTPTDWKSDPEFLQKIPNLTYREFATCLHETWRNLARKTSSNVKENLEKVSLIWVPNPVIVPGGRFQEFYYWDSYWIIKGLLISEMHCTVKGMLDNYLYLVKKYGYIPNGGRIYYLGRSQPPFLIQSFKLYMDASQDLNYLEKSIETLETEFDFWLTHRVKRVEFNGKQYKMAFYNDTSQDGPRPESYSEDVNSANSLDDKREFYRNIKAACESGMDFSSRWFISSQSSNEPKLQDIKTTSIIPVDLNAFLYGNALILSEFNRELMNFEKADHYKSLAEQFLDAVNSVLWHEEIGTWLDYDLENCTKRNHFLASNLVPLWTGCYDKNAENDIITKNLKYLDKMNVLNFPGGIPYSLINTGEQWDFPNAWPPLQHMIIFGLAKTQNIQAQKIAKNLATKWLNTNYEAFKATKNMAEKYDATIVGGNGGGGEYSVQFGFGWTNAVILDILVEYFSEN